MKAEGGGGGRGLSRVDEHAFKTEGKVLVEPGYLAVYRTDEVLGDRNVLRRGSDVTVGQTVVAAGSPLAPAMTGLLAASGLERVPVHPRPRVGVVATGDEVVPPGRPLGLPARRHQRLRLGLRPIGHKTYAPVGERHPQLFNIHSSFVIPKGVL